MATPSALSSRRGNAKRRNLLHRYLDGDVIIRNLLRRYLDRVVIIRSLLHGYLDGTVIIRNLFLLLAGEGGGRSPTDEVSANDKLPHKSKIAS